MICTDCKAATITQGHWRQYNTPQCLYCTARWIQMLPKVIRSWSTEKITAERRAVLSAATAYGHSEKDIRALVDMKEMALQPAPEKARHK